MRADELHPDGTYAKAVLDNDSKDRIYELMDAIHLTSRVPKEDLHTTIMYSRKPCPKAMEMNGTAIPFRGKISGFNVWEDRGTKQTCLVAVVDCDFLRSVHEYMQKTYDAVYDFPKFIPHITLSYDGGDNKYNMPSDDYIVKYTVLNIKPLRPIKTEDQNAT
jgi:2'-5' RNA ligase